MTPTMCQICAPLLGRLQEAIALLVRRKLGVTDEKEVERIVWAVVEKLRREGQEGTFFVRDAVKGGTVTKFMKAEINRRLAEVDPRLAIRFGRKWRGR